MIVKFYDAKYGHWTILSDVEDIITKLISREVDKDITDERIGGIIQGSTHIALCNSFELKYKELCKIPEWFLIDITRRSGKQERILLEENGRNWFFIMDDKGKTIDKL